jgi:hypothetical protein
MEAVYICESLSTTTRLHGATFQNDLIFIFAPLEPETLHHKQMKSRRMRWAGHVAHMGESWKVYKVFGGESPKERAPSEDRGVDGIMGSEWILKRLEWIQLAQDRDPCRAVVNAAMNLRVLAPRS